jgi:hypothetical protein
MASFTRLFCRFYVLLSRLRMSTMPSRTNKQLLNSNGAL